MTIQFLSNVRRGERYTILLSDEDSDLLHYNWTVNPKGTQYPFNNKLGTLHTTIIERKLGRSLCKGEEVDHKNRNKLDAQRDNIRLSTSSQNKHNRGLQSNNVSGFRGVGWDKRMRFWKSNIKHKGRVYFIGHYEAREDAGIAWNHEASRLFGDEFTEFNDIPNWREIFPVRKSLGYPRTNSRNKSGYRGVCRTPDKKRWQAQITKDNSDYNLGAFDDKHEAARAWNIKSRELYGVNAYQNVIEVDS